MMFGTADLLIGSHQLQGDTCKLHTEWGTTQALSPAAQHMESEVGFLEYVARTLRGRKMGRVKQVVSQMMKAVQGDLPQPWSVRAPEHHWHWNTEEWHWRVTGAKYCTRKFPLNYTKAKSTTKLEQLLGGWIQGKSVHCRDFDKQPTEIRSAFLNAGQNKEKEK